MKRVVAQLRIAEVPVSNLGPETSILTEMDSGIPQTPQKMPVEYLKLIHDHFLPLPHSLFYCPLIIPSLEVVQSDLLLSLIE
jgi:hypothetical protein